MKSTNAEERCKAKDILDMLCSPQRKILYDFIYDWDQIDAILVHEHNINKQCGIARIFSSPCNFGNKPVVELPKEAIDFMRELALLMGKAGAAVIKFRDKVMYWKIDDRELQPRQIMKRGKPYNYYLLPINLLKNV